MGAACSPAVGRWASLHESSTSAVGKDPHRHMLAQVYTNIRRFKEDLGRYPPHYFVCVPLVLDTLYKRVQVSCLPSTATWAPGADYALP